MRISNSTHHSSSNSSSHYSNVNHQHSNSKKSTKQIPSPICKYFSQNGTCRNGSNCAFRHVAGVEKTSSTKNGRSPPRTVIN